MSDFQRLSHDEQLRHLARLATQAASGFGLGVERISLLQYEDNAVYRLLARDGREYALRIGADVGYSPAEQGSELEWLQFLWQGGQLVPQPITSPQGSFVLQARTESVASRSCVLFRWLPGELPQQDISEQQMNQLGAIVARLHDQSRTFVPSLGFTRPRLDWGAVFGGEAPAMPVPPLEREILARLGERLQSPLAELSALGSQAAGLIHGDLHRDNILLEGDAISLIDFDDCGWGYYLFDVACLLDSFRRRVLEPSDYGRLRAAFLEGYEPCTSSAADLEQLLPPLKALRDAITLRFILSSSNRSVQSWAGPRVKELVRHIQSFIEGAPAEI